MQNEPKSFVVENERQHNLSTAPVEHKGSDNSDLQDQLAGGRGVRVQPRAFVPRGFSQPGGGSQESLAGLCGGNPRQSNMKLFGPELAKENPSPVWYLVTGI